MGAQLLFASGCGGLALAVLLAVRGIDRLLGR